MFLRDKLLILVLLRYVLHLAEYLNIHKDSVSSTLGTFESM